MHPAPAQLNDIACNTLPYAFAQMGLLPQIVTGDLPLMADAAEAALLWFDKGQKS